MGIDAMKPRKDGAAAEEKALFKAECRSRSTRLNVEVLDLSAVGCMIAVCGWTFRQNERTFVRLPGLRFLPATVLWADEESAGLQFDEPLYEPVLAHLLRNRRS